MAGTIRMIEWRRVSMTCALSIFGLLACDEAIQPPASVAGLELSALDGSVHRPIPSESGQVTVLLFSASDCPVANGYAPEIRAIHGDYAERGIRLFVVNVESSTPAGELSVHAVAYGLPGPILMDRHHALATQVGAEVTPEAVVLRPGGDIAYRGRIDDQYRTLGVRRPLATRRDLRDALDAVLAGRPVAVPRTAAVGCFIEDWAH